MLYWGERDGALRMGREMEMIADRSEEEEEARVSQDAMPRRRWLQVGCLGLLLFVCGGWECWWRR